MISPTLFKKIDLEYIEFVIRYKFLSIDFFLEDATSFRNLLFGIETFPESLFGYGDFIILSFINSLGLFFLLLYILTLNKIFPHNRIYLYALLISSLHYGALFTVTGQLISAVFLSSHNAKNRPNYLSEI